jgi:hypothetical protein
MVGPVSISYAIEITFAADSDRLQPRVSKQEIMTQSKRAEPPSREGHRVLMVGQDRRGNCVVQEQSGNCGGLFVTRDAALRYVRDENREQQWPVVMNSGIIELDANRRPSAASERVSGTMGSTARARSHERRKYVAAI